MMDLAAKLASEGVLTPEWIEAFRAVSREKFLPETLWVQDGEWFRPVHRSEDPERWQELADSEKPVITQVDDGEPAGPDGLGSLPTSSSSMPYMVALMLKHLEVGDGHRVLEIGTGTGWNAAIMAHRLGGERVTTVEVDPDLARQAQKTFIDVGFAALTALVRDGLQGCPTLAPYERVISTAACHTVPYAWVKQCTPGGRIVTPWGSEFANWGLLALDVHDDKTASGAVVDVASFMRLRGQRVPFKAVNPSLEEEAAASATARWTTIKPGEIIHNGRVMMAVGSRVRQCTSRFRSAAQDEHGEQTLILSDYRTGSWARLRADPEAPNERRKVLQGGTRRLWDEVEAAYQWWIDQGRPDVKDWLITVDEHGQRMELV